MSNNSKTFDFHNSKKKKKKKKKLNEKNKNFDSAKLYRKPTC